MQVVKTAKIPVHYSTTRRKLSILDKLTARLTYGVALWSGLVEEYGVEGRSRLRSRALEARVKERTGLSAGFVQCCGDTALWMWRSYRELHRTWAKTVKMADSRKEQEWLKKLKRREPTKPISSGVRHKIPIWFDYRVGKLKKAKRIKIVSHEKEGYVRNVVFPCGTVVSGNTVYLYHGAADSYVCVATAPLKEILSILLT